MELANGTTVEEFILLGLQVGQQKRFVLLVFFTVLYILILFENIIIITLVLVVTHLARLTVYILLSNFSWLEICYVSTTVPRMISDLLSPYGIISFQPCFLQFYFVFSLGSTECFLLSSVALDRYLAICHPLRYPQIMSQKCCSALAAICWVIGFSVYIIPVTWISRMSFYGPKIIDHFLCDSGPILNLACPPINSIPIAFLFSINVLVILGNFVLILVSYDMVILTLRQSSNQGSQKKAFNTVSFHLILVILFYGSVAGMYVTPDGEGKSKVIEVVAIFYTHSHVQIRLCPMLYNELYR